MADMYVMDQKTPHAEALVDGITLVHGGSPQELTEDQVKRLKAIGVKVTLVTEDEDESAEEESVGDVSMDEEPDSIGE